MHRQEPAFLIELTNGKHSMTPRKQGASSPQRKRIAIADLRTDPMTFQFREEELTQYHVDDLVTALKGGKELDPMTVWINEQGHYIVIDGHHRLAAYQAESWKKKVKVDVHSCSQADALLLALSENAKARLPMTQIERGNAAWALVRGKFDYSKRQIVEATGISSGTVATMRRIKKQLEAEEEHIPEDWKEALRLSQGKEGKEMTEDLWEAIIQQRTNLLDDKVGKDIAAMAEIQIEAVERMLSRRLGQKVHFLAEEWREDLDADDDFPF